MTDADKMRVEKQRVSGLLAEAVSGIEADGGDIRFFNAAFLVAAIQLHSEVEGADTILKALTKVGVNEVSRAGMVGEC